MIRVTFKNKKSSRETGFTLVEMLLVVGITTALMAGITLLFRNIIVYSRQENNAGNAIDQGRQVATNFINEVRNATYGADASFALGEACNNEIILFTSYRAGTGKVNRVRYYISGTSLYKGVTASSGTPATYNPGANEKISDVLDNVTNGVTTCSGSTAAFNYYDGDYAGTGSALSQSVNVNTVKYVQLNLLVKKQDITGSAATFTINDGAALRNLKTNLGD